METAAGTEVMQEELIYPSEKSQLFAWAIWGSVAITIILVAGAVWTVGSEILLFSIAMILLSLLTALFMAWLWFDTGYKINGNKLLYRSGPIRGTIDINSITHITKNETSFSGLKPALATKGLIIRYGDWKEIYISPERKDKFVDVLLQINPQITIKVWDEGGINFNKY